MAATTTPTGEALAGAASHEPMDWQAIDWHKAHRNVRRLQVRIVKATQEGKWGRVKALQHLLTHSFSGKALAVRRVTENQGKRTPGVDGITWGTPEQKATAITRLRQRSYRPHPLKRVYIPSATRGRLDDCSPSPGRDDGTSCPIRSTLGGGAAR
jgi:RNA-directed DNA polymerase